MEALKLRRCELSRLPTTTLNPEWSQWFRRAWLIRACRGVWETART